jgi:hypothetical protein
MLGGALVLGGAVLTVGLIAQSSSPAGPSAPPTEVRDFAAALPRAQQPNAAGVTIVDGRDAPNTWRVAWETGDAAFCLELPEDIAAGAPFTVTTFEATGLDDKGRSVGHEVTATYP